MVRGFIADGEGICWLLGGMGCLQGDVICWGIDWLLVGALVLIGPGGGFGGGYGLFGVWA